MTDAALSSLRDLLQSATARVREALIAVGVPENELGELSLTPPPSLEQGDLALPCFPFAKVLRKSPAAIAEATVGALSESGLEAVAAGGFLNLRFAPGVLTQAVVLGILRDPAHFVDSDEAAGQSLLVEFSSPNTNKPQHLGHARNNVLGQAVSTLAERIGYRVERVNLINDRGIHICKSMVAYRRFAEGATPEAAGKKGDHFVGDLYVGFSRALAEEHAAHVAGGGELGAEAFFNSPDSSLGNEARAMLRDWEAGEAEVRALWARLNGWVLEGFAATYARLGIAFDRVQRESELYLLGKQLVEAGLAKGVFARRADGAVVCDLAQLGRKGLSGQKVLLRADGTSVYMTQDLGTAVQRFEGSDPARMIYVVGDEQDHHFKVLFGVLELLRPGFGARCEHLSYGMVHLPSGRMKSREGTVIDLDDLLDELVRLVSAELGQRERSASLSPEELERRAEVIGQAALRYYWLAHSPPSTIQFDPQRSIAFRGDTGPYLLYAYARTQQILAKAGAADVEPEDPTVLDALTGHEERALLRELFALPRAVDEAARALDPSRLCARLLAIGQAFSAFYNAGEAGAPSYPVIHAAEPERSARLALVAAVGCALETGLGVLGIEVLEEM